ncbi:MAG: endonuclease MutS2 [Zetaproteobacteria bacterium]|nr:MAG: endonuclease MutS2 [Zetaproteobacteria bacterium]
MDAHSLRVLEFSEVLQHLAADAASDLGRRRAMALAPATDPDLVLQRLTETREARALLNRGPVTGLERATDIREAVARAAVAGARLAPLDLWAVADTLEAAERARRHLQQADLHLPRLAAIAVGLRPPPALWREIRRSILPDGSVADAASPELSRLRARGRAAREAVREHLQALLGAPQLQSIVVEPVITLRNDRYVIPVLPGYRTHVAGIVQDQAGSGHTVFLEPLSAVEQNNAIRRLDREAEAEADRILGDLTAKVGAARDEIGMTVDALADLDLVLSKARLAERWGGAEPRLEPDGTLSLRSARHPLLVESRRRRTGEAARDEVVPVDVPLTPGARVLVVTGPNAGGKTVALKTVGLLALMVQAGLHIPASPDSVLPVFGAVYADIGDEQSIAHDLSSFSAHISRIRGILAAVDRTSLVLLDEIGAGTDPGEGAALGNAVLESLARRGAHVVATTHLDGIKAFVAKNSDMTNGAVEFDLDRMQPVYKLHIGFPGRSYAIDVASRLGIPPSIVQRAREFVGDSAAGVADLLDRLRTLESQRADEADRAAQERAVAVRAREEAEEVARDLRARAATLRAQAGRVIAEIAAEARRRVESVVADLKRGRPIQEARQAIGRLPELTDLEPLGLPETDPGGTDDESPLRIEPGQQVRIRHLGQVGTVVSDANAQGWVEVQLPVGKARVPLSALSPAGPAIPRREAPISWTAGAGDDLSAEINVIGCTVEEATRRVERYLEDAVLGGLTRVRIIHGKGTGRLRRGVAALLKEHPLVANFQIASFDEGGAGATTVDLGTQGADAPPATAPPATG